MPTGSFDYDTALDELLDAAPGLRERLLDAHETAQPGSRARLSRLLQFALSEPRVPASIEETAPGLFSEMLRHQDLERIGSKVGPYRVVEFIDRGGMGVVFRGERSDGAYEQRVAIKFLPRLASSKQRRDLFLAERANLARLEHPNIARIIDAGVTSDDAPYFIMELVEGIRLDAFCEGLAEQDVLDVFGQVCDAVAYCHQSFVVHGDIKPDNILVADQRARLLDFGIGKWESETSDALAGAGYTARYAAPEVVAGGRQSVAADIFALGILLGEVCPRASAARAAELDAVIGRCTADAPADRYGSVDALRRDIDALRKHFPVSGRSDESPYLLRKFVRRNRRLVGAMASVIAALAVGLTASLWQYSQARLQAQRAEETASFVFSLFDRVNPEDAGAEDLTLRQLMDEASIRLDNELASSPEVKHDIKALIAAAYFGLGDYETSRALHEQILAYHRSTKRAPHPDIADALGNLGSDYALAGDYERAVQLMGEAIELHDALGEESLALADLLGRYGLALRSHNDDGAQMPDVLAAFERKGRILARLAPDDAYLQYIHLSNLASGQDALGEWDKGLALKEQAIALAENNGYALLTTAITTLCNLGYSYGALGRWQDAIDTGRQCIARREKRLGAEHPSIIAAKQNLAATYISVADFTQATTLLEDVVKASEERLPETAMSRLAAEANLARAQVLTGQPEPALARLPFIIARMSRATGERTAPVARVQSIFGRALFVNGQFEAALTQLREAYAILHKSLYWQQEGHTWVSDVTLWRAEAEMMSGDPNLAAELAKQGFTVRQAEPNVAPWRIEDAQRVVDLIRK